MPLTRDGELGHIMPFDGLELLHKLGFARWDPPFAGDPITTRKEKKKRKLIEKLNHNLPYPTSQ